MIGNIEGVDGVIDNLTFRIFSEPTPAKRVRCFYKKEEDFMEAKLTETQDN